VKRDKLLILRLSAVGDVLRTLPAVKALKEHFPSSHITWVVEDQAKTLLESQPEIDRVILFPRKRWESGIKSPKGIWRTIGEVVRFILDLRKEKYGAVFDFHGILKSGLLSYLSGSPKRIGFGRHFTKEGNFLFSNIRVRLPQKRISRYQRNLALLRGIGLELEAIEHRLHIPPGDREYVDSFFSAVPGQLRRPLIAIHPGTSSKTPYKRWAADRYAELADRLIRDLNATVILTWGPEEREWAEEIRGTMKEPSMLSPRTETLTQLGEVFRRCDLYIGGDTGPMHIASLVGTAVVVIYGPTDPVVNEPLGRYGKVRKAVGCNPCRKRSCQELRCLKAVTPEAVLKAAKEVLSAAPPVSNLVGTVNRNNRAMAKGL
jgi:heptosyltransferase I